MFEESIHPDTTQSAKMSKNVLLDEEELDYEELDDTESSSTTGSVSTDSKRPSTGGSGDDSRAQDSAKPIQRKRVHNVIAPETAMKETCNETRRRTPPTTPIRRYMPPPPYKENNRFVSSKPSPSFRRNLFNNNVKKYFHSKALYCLAIRKEGFTLSEGTLSTLVDNDTWWKRTLTNLLLKKKLERVSLVDVETKNQFNQIAKTLTNIQAVKLHPPSDRTDGLSPLVGSKRRR
ncbi:hypothetical protein CDAR_298741 [Caerostris darwini]|uniref:Uncharacterized protein n=1 Tax=Caerostris darwini TaxID=1538125 RepID=A0AAV4MT97_9ARAC|nr:hypothetical protein CDAR_298741 [Caerostris darwini]